LWNTNGQLIHTFEGHTEGVIAVAFTTDGKNILTASGDYRVALKILILRKLSSFIDGRYIGNRDHILNPC